MAHYLQVLNRGRDSQSPIKRFKTSLTGEPDEYQLGIVAHRWKRGDVKPLPAPELKRGAADPSCAMARASTATRESYLLLPHDLAYDIQQFIESAFAKQYLSTHHTGFIFKHKVPVAQIMAWQKMRSNAHIHGIDGKHAHVSSAASLNGQEHMSQREKGGLVEEERWLLGERLRDEIYCQAMKQLNGNRRRIYAPAFGLYALGGWVYVQMFVNNQVS
ncbi:hypothetical protein OE88DRAFT_1649477 [Heliocybe sulcata]|uniref:Uncharacterized protein n=1 Tax=Heliocybe sulcata TaxID=5364 RepID=A0A5C3MJ46_9AGAM|nr:hypothetical protein OE88DRAFT_1649477 [Heliocybe sulcata]